MDTPIGTVTVDHFTPAGIRQQVVVGPEFLYALFNPKDRLHPWRGRSWRSFGTGTSRIAGWS